MKKSFNKRLLVSITAKKGKGWEKKLQEIKKLKINKFALFIEEIEKKDRKELYKTLESLGKIEIPLVHIRHDTDSRELKYLKNKYKTKYFTIHEFGFNILKNWKGFYKNLYLEMNYDNYIPKNVDVSRIGGFCIDISHFKLEEEFWTKEFLYILKRMSTYRYFRCNHLNGYDPIKKKHLHKITSLKQFDYLSSLPEFIFGDIIAIETYNTIKQQLKFKEHLTILLDKKFNK